MSLALEAYSSKTDRPGELYHNFSISNNLTQIIDFPARILDFVQFALSHLFLSFDCSICSTVAFPALENFDQFVVSISIDFLLRGCPFSLKS